VFACDSWVDSERLPVFTELFDNMKVLDSWRYPDLGAWQYDPHNSVDGEGSGKLLLQMGPNKKVGQENLEFICSDEIGSRCCKLMEQHAIIMFQLEKTKRSEDRELARLAEKQTCDALLGDYRVSKQVSLRPS